MAHEYWAEFYWRWVQLWETGLVNRICDIFLNNQIIFYKFYDMIELSGQNTDVNNRNKIIKLISERNSLFSGMWHHVVW
jgi:hypothetical protein